MTNYIIVSNRKYHPNWIEAHSNMLETYLKYNVPSRVYFPFWSSTIPKPILTKYECIGFHTGDERGGSPIQHLIRLNKNESRTKMFEMTEKLDEGKEMDSRVIYLQGSLEEILLRMSKSIMEMISAKENYKEPTPPRY